MSNKNTFIQNCLNGDALIDEIDDYVDLWHDDEDGDDIELHEFLGMTEKEYSLWVEKGDRFLKDILAARKHGHELVDWLEEPNAQVIAARATSSEEAASIVDWLRRTGR